MMYGLYLYVQSRGYQMDLEVSGSYQVDCEGGYWRAYLCLNHVLCLNEADPETFYKSARAFGKFFNKLGRKAGKIGSYTRSDQHAFNPVNISRSF